MKEKHKIYIFSVLSHSALGAVVYAISSLFMRNSFGLDEYLIWCGVGIVALPFIKLYEPTYRFFFDADRDRKG